MTPLILLKKTLWKMLWKPMVCVLWPSITKSTIKGCLYLLHSAERTPAYTWTQSEEDVVVTFVLKQSTEKNAVIFSLSSTEVCIGTEEEGKLLTGELHAAVDVEGSTWTLKDKTMFVKFLLLFSRL
jgi:hypothetical protein